jgi:F420-dependent oxidoreductase-like protein
VTGPVALPAPCAVVLVGAGASGKSTWAATHFAPDAVVSSDALRAMVGAGPDDLDATEDAFALLEQIVAQRLRRRLTTVIDTLGLDPARRRAWLAAARAVGLPCIAVAFDTDPELCRERNRARARRIPADALTRQLRGYAHQRPHLEGEGFDQVLPAVAVRAVPQRFSGAAAAASRQEDDPLALRFGIQLGSFAFTGGATHARDRLRGVARQIEEAGFDAIYLMDHFRQIPQVGRVWEDMHESWTTLAYLAACTETVSLGPLVAGVTYRNPAHLAKIAATLDVLSGGRAVCGVGLGWFEAEHAAWGWPFPSVADRYALLEDVLQLLPLMWGKGSPAFEGRVLAVPEALCYPRPVQEHVPILLGGGGERRTLRLAARYADRANVFGDVATVRRKTEVLHGHCRDAGRDPQAVAMTTFGTVLVGADDHDLAARIEARRGRTPAARFGATAGAGTVADHVGRFRELAEVGVREAIVAVSDLDDGTALERMARVIAAFRR